MARETKIGLLVGMGVIIFIGILVSDHLAQTQPQLQVQDPFRLQALDQSSPAGQTDEPVPAPARPVQPIPAVSPSPAPAPATTPAAPVQPVPAPQPAPAPAAPATPVPGPAGSPRPVVQPVPSSPPAPAPRPGVAGHPLPTQPAQPPRPVVRPVVQPVQRLRVHHVQKGETLYKLAEKYYGNGNLWRLIVKANADKVGSNGSVRSGVRLVIPDRPSDPRPAAVQAPRTPPAAASGPEVSADRAPAPAAAAPAPSEAYTTYTVQRGDVLSVLAQRFYGTTRKTRQLYELNKDRIPDPDSLPAGIVIRVPVRR